LAGCDQEINGLPILTGCPSPNEYFLVIGAASGQGQGGYGLRSYSDLQVCFAPSIKFAFLQFIVGDPGSPMNAGDSVLVINQANVIFDSVGVILGGVVLPRNDDTQWSYVPTYTANNVTIDFDSEVSDGQEFVIVYAYAAAPAIIPPVPAIIQELSFRVGDGGQNTPSAGSNVYNPPVNPLVGRVVLMMFQQNILISPSPTEVSGDINWTFVSLSGGLSLANGEFDNNTTYTIIYQ
jgi:hypothetical protein